MNLSDSRFNFYYHCFFYNAIVDLNRKRNEIIWKSTISYINNTLLYFLFKNSLYLEEY